MRMKQKIAMESLEHPVRSEAHSNWSPGAWGGITPLGTDLIIQVPGKPQEQGRQLDVSSPCYDQRLKVLKSISNIRTYLFGEHLLGTSSSFTHSTPSLGRKFTWWWPWDSQTNENKAGGWDASLVKLSSDISSDTQIPRTFCPWDQHLKEPYLSEETTLNLENDYDTEYQDSWSRMVCIS